MDQPFIIFQRYNDRQIADDIAQIFRENGINCIVKADKQYFDPTFAFNKIDPEISIQLRSEDFSKAHAVMQDYYGKLVENVEKDYYLLDFTDDELMEIVTKPEEWGHFDYKLAQKLLKERGKEIKPETAALLKSRRIEQLTEPDKISRYWVYAGYISAILGGFLGLIIGWILAYYKKTLPDGRRINAYGKKEQKHGRIILVLSIFGFILWIAVKLAGTFNRY